MRQIYKVDATQVVVSEAHPEGLYSVISGYPKQYDSRNYNASDGNPNGDEEAALRAAKAEYFSRLSAFYVGSPTRVMATVTLTRVDGKQIMHENLGAFPDMTPEPEPTPEPEAEAVEE